MVETRGNTMIGMTDSVMPQIIQLLKEEGKSDKLVTMLRSPLNSWNFLRPSGPQHWSFKQRRRQL